MLKNLKTGIILLMAAVVCIAAFLLFYPVAIFHFSGRYVGNEWSSIINNRRDLSDIEMVIGKPFIDDGVKNVEKWEKNYWWGRKELNIIYSYHNQPPSVIEYEVYISGYLAGGKIYSNVIGGKEGNFFPKKTLSFPSFYYEKLIFSDRDDV